MPEPLLNFPVLQDLFPELPLGSFATLSVGPLQSDSRRITSGETFVAVIGSENDGREYIESAVAKGAALLLVEGAEFALGSIGRVPQVIIPDLSKQLGRLAAYWYDNPSHHMTMVGVTGTNGKTSCCQWLAEIIEPLLQNQKSQGKSAAKSSDGAHAGTIGTLGYGNGRRLKQTGLTTPGPIDVQKILAEMRAGSCQFVAMEVSSHSLDQGRVNGVNFDVALLTNIGRDHLDYHGSLAEYVKAKARLMGFSSLSAAVVNADDVYASDFVNAAKPGVRIIQYGVENTSADFHVRDIALNAFGSSFTVCSPEGQFRVSTPLWGRFNIANLLGVIACGYALGYPVDMLVQNCRQLTPVPGRLELVGKDSDITVLIDYAHTADALTSVLTAIRAHVRGNIWCVFGCGGDRDRGKRPLMAEATEAMSDFVVVTSDNPRTEDPVRILDDVVRGFGHPEAVHRILDRETAIRFAIEQAAAGDCVLIAGKGHEDYQIIGKDRLPFSDLAIARSALQVRPVATDPEVSR